MDLISDFADELLSKFIQITLSNGFLPWRTFFFFFIFFSFQAKLPSPTLTQGQIQRIPLRSKHLEQILQLSDVENSVNSGTIKQA